MDTARDDDPRREFEQEIMTVQAWLAERGMADVLPAVRATVSLDDEAKAFVSHALQVEMTLRFLNAPRPLSEVESLTSDTHDNGPESLAEENADLKERNEELEAIVDGDARIKAAYGIAFTDNGYMVIADRAIAIARLGEDAVKRLEDD